MKRFSGMAWPMLLLALLAILAWLQFRWTGQIRDAEQERMRASLQSSVRRFVGDVDDELTAVFQTFRVDHADELGDRIAHYRDESRYPELVSEIHYVDLDGGIAKLETDGEIAKLVPVDWPESFAALRARLRMRAEAGRRGGPPFPFPALWTAPTVIAVPVVPRDRRWPGFSRAGYALISFEGSVLRESILPELVARHFGSEYDVVVVDPRGGVWFTTAANGEEVSRHPDARGALFAPGRDWGRAPRPGGRRPPPPELTDFEDRRPERAWEVLVRHQSGSLESYVMTTRTRNLIVSFGILGILAASVGLVAVSTRRATELNDRKVEFIAGVSHELRTPVAVLRSAGQNLADGSVVEADQVRRYGALIESEGRRLNDLVEQVLELAGAQSQNRRLRRETVPAEDLIADALTDCDTARTESGVEVATHFPREGVTLIGDRDAMRRAVGNVLMNAIKHGGDGKTVDVTVERRGPKVAIEVADHGPGISEDERKHVFDPFYRGRRAHDRRVPGSGLGLSLVDHIVRDHGGSVEVESIPGEGSRFTLYFPANG